MSTGRAASQMSVTYTGIDLQDIGVADCALTQRRQLKNREI